MKRAINAILFLAVFSGIPFWAGMCRDSRISDWNPEAAESFYRSGDYSAAIESFYRSGDYSAAISAYEEVLQQGWVSGEIYYNLGNCYYKLGQYGRAILYYERARKFLGSDPDLQLNLKLANLRIYDRIEPLPRIFLVRVLEAVGELLTVRRWALILIIAEWVVLISLILLHIVRRPRWRRPLVGGLVFASVLFILSGSFFLQQKIQLDRLVEGVVLAQKVEVRSAPESGSTELFALHEGVKMRILRQVSGWAEIKLADGKRGWMPQSAFEII